MSDWIDTTIGDVLTLQRGYDITRENQRPGVVPVVSSGGIASSHDTAMSDGPGVVIGRKGTLGKVFYLDHPYWPHDTTLWVKDFKGSCPRFVYYFFKQLDVMGFDVGSANPTLNRNHVHPLKINWPAEASTQLAIAELLGALDDKIAANAKLAAVSEELLSAEFEGIGMNVEEHPTGRVIPMDTLVEFNPPVPRPRESIPIYVDMQKLPTSGMSISNWEVRPAQGGARFQNGDTLLARITPCLENRKTGYVDFLEENQIAIGSTEYIVLRSRPGVPQALTYFLAVDPRFRAFAIRHMVGTSGRQRVSASDLAGYELNVPEPDALVAFGRKSDQLFVLNASLRDESRQLAMTRDALLPLLMSGKLRVKDAEKQVEAQMPTALNIGEPEPRPVRVRPGPQP